MPLSMVTNEAKQLVKKSGYSILAWALKTFLAQGQQKLVAMIIVTLCLAPRKAKLDDNGVRAVLRNFQLRQKATKDQELMYYIMRLAEDSGHYDKVGATLVAAWWWEYHRFTPRHTDPMLSTDDSCMFFNSAVERFGNTGDRQYQDELCDHAGCQREREFPHYRLVLEYEGYDGVRIIGKQMGEWRSTAAKCKQLPNGYFEYRVHSNTVLYRINDELDGRTLEDVLEPGVWYNYHFRPDTELDLVDHERQRVMQTLANTIMKVGQLNG